MNQEVSGLELLLEKQKTLLEEKEKHLYNVLNELEENKKQYHVLLEESNRRNELLNFKLEQSLERNYELSKLIHRSTHDLKSPLSSVEGLIYLMRQESISPRADEYLGMIIQLMSNMSGILQSISLFKKVATEEIQYVLIPAIDLVHKVIWSFSDIKDFDDIHIHIDVNPDLIIKTDLTLMEAAMKILVENAILYRNKIEPDILIRLSFTKTDMYIVVQDNGDGMDDEIFHRAFDMFYRGSNKSKGSGLGLYIAQKIVHKLGGNITLFQQPVGLKVEIQLPFLLA